ncbi:hypothetical protein BC937DRAFT_95680, partial [Endogone sp. FLAS-F59071]
MTMDFHNGVHLYPASQWSTSTYTHIYYDEYYNLSATATSPALASWTYLGCIVDPVYPRALPYGAPGGSVGMTNALCTSECQAMGCLYARTEYAKECWCGNTIPTSVAPDDNTDCSMTYSSNTSEKCGAPNRLSVYILTNPQKQPVGSMVDTINPRSLPYAAPGGSSGMTIELTSKCKANGYTFAGTEKCYCGQTQPTTFAPGGETDCSIGCSGNPYETCGGSARLSVYCQTILCRFSALSNVANIKRRQFQRQEVN